jgi:hypothetical protein
MKQANKVSIIDSFKEKVNFFTTQLLPQRKRKI